MGTTLRVIGQVEAGDLSLTIPDGEPTSLQHWSHRHWVADQPMTDKDVAALE